SGERRVGEKGRSPGAPRYLKKKKDRARQNRHTADAHPTGLQYTALVSRVPQRRRVPSVFLHRVSYLLWLFFFFFQAEDGIRDSSVTGVQTCALPIWFCVPATGCSRLAWH